MKNYHFREIVLYSPSLDKLVIYNKMIYERLLELNWPFEEDMFLLGEL